jgi:tRNA threonylcarbamoyladenosine biosynthesis protein TsaB
VKLLAIETATPAASVAIGDGEQLAAQAMQVDRRGHVGFLVAALDFCFDRAGWQPSELDAVVVDVGPGLFTGIRAGIATAQGVAAAVGAPLIPVTALDAVAFRAATARRRIWAVVDTRKGQVAAAPYRPVPGGVIKDGPPELVTPQELRGVINSDSRDALVVGDWQALPEGTLRGVHRIRTGRPRYPTADVLVELAAGRVERGEFRGADALEPLYMREPDATINWQDFRIEGMWPGSTSG